MQTLNQACLSRWDEVNHRNSEVGESRQGESAQWPECIDSLSAMLASRNGTDVDSTAPSREAITTAMRYLQALRRQYPQGPPTLIVPEPAGGIIVERRITSAEGDDVIVELMFSNDSAIESTLYRNGKVVHMEQSK
jgi:hypothetical protein